MCCLEAVPPVSVSALEPQFPHLRTLLLIRFELFEAGMQTKASQLRSLSGGCLSHCQPPGKISFLSESLFFCIVLFNCLPTVSEAQYFWFGCFLGFWQMK